MPFDQWIRDTWERVVATFIAGVCVWLAAAPTIGVTWVEALVAATIPPVLVVIMSATPHLTYRGDVWWIDAVVRTARSFVQSAGGLLIVTGTDLLSVGTWQAAAVIGGYSALATIKAIAARHVKDTITPASFTHR